jgi:hypothetical protein
MKLNTGRSHPFRANTAWKAPTVGLSVIAATPLPVIKSLSRAMVSKRTSRGSEGKARRKIVQAKQEVLRSAGRSRSFRKANRRSSGQDLDVPTYLQERAGEMI